MKRPLEKRDLFLFWPRKKPFTEWAKLLRKTYTVRSFSDPKLLLSAILFSPPQILLFYYSKNSPILQSILNLKQNFNLLSLAIVLVIRPEDLAQLFAEDHLTLIDDFFLTTGQDRELKVRLKLCLSRLSRISDNNPLTGLPGNVSIELAIKRALESSDPLAVGYVDLDNFKAYNDIYGFSAGDEVIKNLARILQTTIFERTPNSFLGHVGGDDFVFIIPLDFVHQICQEVLKKFQSLLPSFLAKEDLERGYFMAKDRKGNLSKIPLLSVSIALVPLEKGKFRHPGELAVRAAQVKSYVKSLPGSNYFIDRRA